MIVVKIGGMSLKFFFLKFQSLTLLEYCIRYGAKEVQNHAKGKLYIVKTLKEFIYIDELGRDQGANGTQNKI